MEMAKVVSKRSYCNKAKVGCIVVKNDNIIGIGYNGTPSGFENICEINNKTKPEVLHAESNAIMKIAKSNNSSLNADLYCTLSPCVECAKLIIQAGIKNVFYIEKYKKIEGLKLLNKAKVKTLQIIV